VANFSRAWTRFVVSINFAGDELCWVIIFVALIVGEHRH
jgi:hypothetical protein